MVEDEYLKNYVITKLQELMVTKPNAQIVVIDKVFTPEQLIREIIQGTKYGITYLKIFKKTLR